MLFQALQHVHIHSQIAQKEMIELAKDKQSDTQKNMYQLTINNPLEKGYTHEHIFELFRSHFKTLTYMCLADEQGASFHTHIFVFFSSRVRFSMLKRHFPHAHIEACLGNVSDNVNYVKKTGKWELDESKHETKIEGSFEEYGAQPPDSKGIRGDMSELYRMIASNMTNAEIILENQDYILNIDKIDKVRTIIMAERFKNTVRLDLQVIYIFGASGAGKTRGVLEKHGYSNVFRVTDYLHPFDSYSCQPVIAFDEFRSSLSLKNMLLYCDIYPIELPSRYTNKFACYNTVYIITNIPLEKQYIDVQKEDEESWKAFLRRIHKVIHYEDKDTITTYNSVEDYFNRESTQQQFEEVTEEVPF